MKKKQAVLSGLAALTLFDLVGAPAQAQIPPPVVNWTGFYVGVHAGYRTGTVTGLVPTGTDVVDFFPVTVPYSTNVNGSGIFGFQAGYNYQVTPTFLLGIETGWSWGRGTGRFDFASSGGLDPFTTVNYKFQLTWSGSVRGRFGIVSNEWLLYGTGGIAFQYVKVSGTGQFSDSFGGDSVSILSSLSQGKVLYGYVFGAGVERLVVGGWTWRIEYLFADFGRQNFGPVNVSGNFLGDSIATVSGVPVSVRLYTHTARIGITKLFQP